MSECLMFAFALVLLLEGILPFAAPRMWRTTFRRLAEMQDGQVRFLGLLSLAAGLLVLWLARR